MPRVWEIPISPLGGERGPYSWAAYESGERGVSAQSQFDYDRSTILVGRRPVNAMAALMECAPGHEPDNSRDELLEQREALNDALDALDARSRFIFDAIVVERRSVREVGRRLSLSKSHIHRMHARSCAALARSVGVAA